MDQNDENWIKDNLQDKTPDSQIPFEAEIWLSTDGKQTVRVKSDTAEGREAMKIWAKGVFNQILVTYGTKQAQSVKEYAKDPKEDLGKCQKCGSDNARSLKGKIYCKAKCWL